MNILIIGDIVGEPGRQALRKVIPILRQREDIDFVIANGENAAGGSGITPQVLNEILNAGVDVVTSGDHIFKKREILDVISFQDRLLRPANYPQGVAGHGYTVLTAKNNKKIGVINLCGRVFMEPLDCPFRCAMELVKKIKQETELIIVDMHAEATSEKMAMGWYLNGQVSAVVGTHTHVQTADERILPLQPEGHGLESVYEWPSGRIPPHGQEKRNVPGVARGASPDAAYTAYITDIGMTGAVDSVIGRKTEQVLVRFLTHTPTRFEVADKNVQVQGVILAVDENTGQAISIRRIQEKSD
ncbi:MAG: YmdB family metallophosphoesterase [Candidatus Omnitrophica bacterium]|nr:YmdB family metallophosphoesterase [Candidatus Omnitrophota bacterium]